MDNAPSFPCLLQSAHSPEANREGCECLPTDMCNLFVLLIGRCNIRTVITAGVTVEATHSSLGSCFAGECQFLGTKGVSSVCMVGVGAWVCGGWGGCRCVCMYVWSVRMYVCLVTYMRTYMCVS